MRHSISAGPTCWSSGGLVPTKSVPRDGVWNQRYLVVRSTAPVPERVLVRPRIGPTCYAWDVCNSGLMAPLILKRASASRPSQHDNRSPTHGYEPTREAALAAFAKSWRRELRRF